MATIKINNIDTVKEFDPMLEKGSRYYYQYLTKQEDDKVSYIIEIASTKEFPLLRYESDIPYQMNIDRIKAGLLDILSKKMLVTQYYINILKERFTDQDIEEINFASQFYNNLNKTPPISVIEFWGKYGVMGEKVLRGMTHNR